MKLIVEKVANMIVVITENDVVFKSWHEDDFTEKKLKNAINRIQKNYQEPIELINWEYTK